jgi:methionyl-tRNA synthetase
VRTTPPTWPTRLEQYHFIGKDIVTFHAVLARHAAFSGRTPDNIFVHGF